MSDFLRDALAAMLAGPPMSEDVFAAFVLLWAYRCGYAPLEALMDVPLEVWWDVPRLGPVAVRRVINAWVAP